MLDAALDCELREFDFWDMTIGEIVRYIESYSRRYKRRAQEKASYDYILASLIVRGVSITLGSKDSYPTMQDVYKGLFDTEQFQEQQKIAEDNKAKLSALRFKQFAHSYNRKYEEVSKS